MQHVKEQLKEAAKPKTSAQESNQADANQDNVPHFEAGGGTIHVPLYEQPGPRGKFLVAVPYRSYKDKDGKWKKVHRYTSRDLAEHIAYCQLALVKMKHYEAAHKE